MTQHRALVLAAAAVTAALTGGCSLNRSPILPRFDAGRDAPPMDAGRDVPADDVPGPLDTPDVGPPLDVPDDVREDTPPDASPDVPLDTGPDAPTNCEPYGNSSLGLTGYVDCGSPGPGQCSFIVDPGSPRNCNDLCRVLPGAGCVAAYNITRLMCDGIVGGSVGCAADLDPFICTCMLP